MAIVSNITYIDETPQINREKYEKQKLRPYCIKFSLTGVDSSIANGIRRTSLTELETKILTFNENEYKTNDIILRQTCEFIRDNIMKITLLQTVPDDAVFKIDINNTNAVAIDVNTHDIAGLEKYTNNMVICRLEAGCHLKVPLMIKRSTGEIFGCHQLAYTATSIATDEEPLDLTGPEPKGKSSMECNPQNWDLTIATNGELPAKQLVPACCNSIISRLTNIKMILETLVFDNGIGILELNGETHTIGRLITRHICALYPQVEFCAYNVPSNLRKAIVRIRHADENEIKKMLATAIDKIIAIYKEIITAF